MYLRTGGRPVRKYAVGGRTYKGYTGDYKKYGMGPEHTFLEGAIEAPALNPGAGGNFTGGIGIPKPPKQGGAATLGNIVGGLGSINAIGEAFGKENIVGKGLGWLADKVGLGGLLDKGSNLLSGLQGGGLDPRWGTGELANDEMSRALEEMMDPTKPMNAGPTPGSNLLGNLGRGASGLMGGLGVLGGVEQGGVKGAGQALQGASKVADALGKGGPGLGMLGNLGGVLQADFSNPVSALKSVGSAAGLAGNFLGSSVLSGVGAMAAPLALGFAGVQMLNKALDGHGDEKRNSAAFQQAFPGVEFLRVPGGRNMAALAKLPDGRLISMDDYEKLAGSWYGAAYAPDGNQEYWMSEYEKMNALPDMSSQMNPGLLAKLKPIKKAQGGQVTPSYYTYGRMPPPVQAMSPMMAVGGYMEGGQLGYAPGGPSQYVSVGTGASGRADNIDAKLSENEFVIDAETVALLGDGNPDAGAAKLEELRQSIRRHKGQALAKGRISPDAKAPHQYMGIE